MITQLGENQSLNFIVESKAKVISKIIQIYSQAH